MKNKKKVIMPLLVAALLTGAGAGVAGIVSAQTSGTAAVDTASQASVAAATTGTSVTVDAPEAGDVADTAVDTPETGDSADVHQQGPHMDGNVTAVNGTTITVTEEAKEGGAVYTVDARSATVMKNGAAAQLSNIAVGDKVFIDGTANGNSIVATGINVGGPHGGPHGMNDGENPAQ